MLYQISRTASVLNGLKNEPSYEFICEVILKATLSKPRKSIAKVYVN